MGMLFAVGVLLAFRVTVLCNFQDGFFAVYSDELDLPHY